MTKIIGIGFLGLGTVGSQVLNLIKENQLLIEETYHIKFVVHSILVRDIDKKRDVDVSGIYMTSDYEEVIQNPNIQVCFECMGGAGNHKTYEMIKAAINNGKHVIMSSKKCLALYMNQIIEASNSNKVQLRFEATVGGAIPICRTLMSMSKNNGIKKMYGIVNATTNYIVSLMERTQMNFDKALELAKEKGFAENDPSEDIDGWDALYKMSILSRVGMNIDIACDKLTPVSIRSTVDKRKALRKITTNNKVRQIFYIERLENNNISYYIGPVELEMNSMLSSVKENYNMIFVESRNSGLRAFYGKGAGGIETASVMYEDLLDIFKNSFRFEAAKKVKCKNIEIMESMLEE
jgi:homoserine dehydrogenase